MSRANFALPPLPVFLNALDVDGFEVLLVSSGGERHLHERVDQPSGLHQLVSKEVPGERRVLCRQRVDVLLPRHEALNPVFLILAQSLHPFRALASLDLQPDFCEPRIPQDVLEPFGFGRMQQPQALQAESDEGQEGIHGDSGYGQSAAQERKVVWIRERELEVGALLEHGAFDRFGDGASEG